MSYTLEDQRHEARQLPANAAGYARMARVVTAEPLRTSRGTAQEMLARVRAYLPDNYRAELHVSSKVSGTLDVLVLGEDFAGWTMEDYVVPRCASGLIFLEVVR